MMRKEDCFRKREREEGTKELREDHAKKVNKETRIRFDLHKIQDLNQVKEADDQVKEADGFDIDHARRIHHDLTKVYEFENYDDCPVVVQLYAKLGLHHYNIFHKTNFKFRGVEKYHKSRFFGPSRYYITLDAATPGLAALSFQTCVGELSQCSLRYECMVTKPKDHTGKPWDIITSTYLYRMKLPNWYSDDALADKERFYVMKESEWEENDRLILYLELSYVKKRYPDQNVNVSDLKITLKEVVVEIEVDVNERFRDETVYIKYDQDLSKSGGGVCKRRAIFLRRMDLINEQLRLFGNDYPEPEPTISADK